MIKKKTFQLLALSLFLCFTTIIKAQNSSNTDTWEETLEYIKNNSECHDFMGCNKMKFEGNLLYRYSGEFAVDHYIITDLIKLKDVSVDGNWIELKLIGENSISYYQENDEIYYKMDFESVSNQSRNEKLVKAYKHLAYLANKSRE